MRRAFADTALLLGQARQIAQEYRDVRQLVRVNLTDARLHLFQGHILRAYRCALRSVADARRLSLAGERAEAEATVRYAKRALFMPWLWLAVYRRPKIRFTSQPVGGD
jgi:hypothetical protein